VRTAAVAEFYVWRRRSRRLAGIVEQGALLTEVIAVLAAALAERDALRYSECGRAETRRGQRC
jgi:hypothetical protein